MGAVLHLLIRLIDVFATEYRYKPELNIKHPGFKKILKLMIPRSMGLIAWQLNLYIFAVVGMRMIEGGLAAFNFARNIQSFAVSLFGIAFATAVFPNLNAAISKGDKKEFTSNIQKTIHRILFFTIPASVGIIFMAKPITDLILGGGEFGEESLNLTSIILLFFAVSIPFESLTHLFARSYYAMKNTITPMIINVSSLTIIALTTIFVAPKLGIQWFSIGFTIGFTIYTILFVLLLSKHFEGFKLKEFMISLTKTIVSAGMMGTVLYFTKDLAINEVPVKIIHVIRIGLGGATFLFFAYLMKAQELSSIKFILKKCLRK